MAKRSKRGAVQQSNRAKSRGFVVDRKVIARITLKDVERADRAIETRANQFRTGVPAEALRFVVG